MAVSWNYILCDVIRCYYPLVPNGSPSQAARGCWTTSCGLDMVTCMPCCESTWARSEGFMACIGQPSFGMGWALAVYVPTCQSVRECTCTTYMKVGHGLCHCLLFISISLSLYIMYMCVYISGKLSLDASQHARRLTCALWETMSWSMWLGSSCIWP